MFNIYKIQNFDRVLIEWQIVLAPNLSSNNFYYLLLIAKFQIPKQILCQHGTEMPYTQQMLS